MTPFMASVPLESEVIDVLGEIIGTQIGNRYILVISYSDTKMVITIAMKTDSVEDVVRHFTNERVIYFGTPVDLLSENGSYFT